MKYLVYKIKYIGSYNSNFIYLIPRLPACGNFTLCLDWRDMRESKPMQVEDENFLIFIPKWKGRKIKGKTLAEKSLTFFTK